MPGNISAPRIAARSLQRNRWARSSEKLRPFLSGARKCKLSATLLSRCVGHVGRPYKRLSASIGGERASVAVSTSHRVPRPMISVAIGGEALPEPGRPSTLRVETDRSRPHQRMIAAKQKKFESNESDRWRMAPHPPRCLRLALHLNARPLLSKWRFT